MRIIRMAALLILLAVVPARAMVWQVYIGSNFFAPESLVVELADTVMWTNLEGTHNVVEESATPLFTSGSPAPPPWSFTFVFDLPLGVYHYHCEVHPGMSGSVTVIPYATPPNIGFDPVGSVPHNATTGRGFRMTVRATDEEQDLTAYTMSVGDTVSWTPWSPFPAFLIADLSLELLPSGVTLVSNEALTPGPNNLYFRAIDSRGVMSPIIARTVQVSENFRPHLDSLVTGMYNNATLYPDLSAYHEPNADVELQFTASAAVYRGEINAYRLQGTNGVWTEWFADPQFTLFDLAPGNFAFQVVARDIAGALSDTIAATVHLVEFALGDSIVIVDETRNGTGAPGSPNDQQADDFYAALLSDYPHRQHDYTAQGAVSPWILRDAAVVVWHADDRSEFRLNSNTRILGDYLGRGGRLLLSGWDVLEPFRNAVDSAFFMTSSFGYRWLRLTGAGRLTARQAVGMTGIGGFPGVAFDSTKLPASWQGTMDRAWVFSPREDYVPIGALDAVGSGNPFEGRTAAFLYNGPFRVAVFGIPLYFCYIDQAQALIDVLLPMMLSPQTASSPLAPVARFALEQNYPNPFNAVTEIAFAVPRAGPVRLTVYDVLGRHVATILDTKLPAGVHRVAINGAPLSSGVYFVQMRAGDFVQSRKMVLLK